MEEDIKLLENFCEVFRMTQRCIDKYEREEYGETIGQDEIQAIENLIARNKELEEMNKKLESRKYMLNAETEEVTAIPIDNNYIPKSKVREIIQKYYDEYEKEKEYRYTGDVDEEQRILREIEKELLQDMSEEEMIKILQHYLEMEEFDNAGDFLVAIDKILDLYQKEKEKNKELRKPKYIMDFKTNKITKLENDFISKDEIRKFETDIYRSYDYDMGVSESFIKFLEEKGILERN